MMKTYLERLTEHSQFTVGKMYPLNGENLVSDDKGYVWWTSGSKPDWRTHQVGTLKEIGAQVGDEVCSLDVTWTTTVDDIAIYAFKANNYYITKRAAPATPPTFGELTDAEQGALLLAHHRGEVIEFSVDGLKWFAIDPQWGSTVSYRIAPPKPAEFYAKEVTVHSLGREYVKPRDEWTQCDKSDPHAKLFRQVT